MHWSAVGNLLGRLLMVVGVAMFLPLGCALQGSGPDGTAFLGSLVITLGVGIFLLKGSRIDVLGHREGFVVAALGWVVVALFGSLPFLLSGACPSFIDAFFESMAGFTTTGATILTNIEGQPLSILLWRSLSQWLGGMGILLLFVAVFPKAGMGNYQLFRAEAPGPSKGRILPRITETARFLWIVYGGLSLLLFLLLLSGGLSLYDALNHTLTTMATGGFSTKNANVQAFNSPFIEGIIVLFMFLSGTNFALYHVLLKGQWSSLFRDAEFRFYLGSLTVAVVLLVLNTGLAYYGQWSLALRHGIFQGVSTMTGTGFATTDYNLWPTFSRFLLFILMFWGGCGGSTTGGIKQIRILILIKYAAREVYRLAHPRAVIPLRVGNKVIPEEVVSSVMGFFFLYLAFFILGVLMVAAFGLDIPAAMGMVAASIGNVGANLGLGQGVSAYPSLPGAVKLLLTFFMLLGRLEIYTILNLFVGAFQRRGGQH
jgi:trk system potassium uptake protein TrkH